MRFTVQILSMVLAVSLLLGSCTKGEPEQENTIGWSVSAPSSLAAPASSSRALVEGYAQLRDHLDDGMSGPLWQAGSQRLV